MEALGYANRLYVFEKSPPKTFENFTLRVRCRSSHRLCRRDRRKHHKLYGRYQRDEHVF